MGMAASQVRFLQLTSRKNDIGYQLTQLSNDKVTLSRDMQRVSRKYQNALNQKTLKWSNNQGVSYMDISYNNLMKPSSMNKNTPYILTDLNDRVVIDAEYKKYAEMISATGACGGNWESVRTQVLSEITGIDANKIDNAQSYQQAIWDNEKILNKLIDSEPIKPLQKTTLSALVDKLGTETGRDGYNYDWGKGYRYNGVINVGNFYLGALDAGTAIENLDKILTHLEAEVGQFVQDPENLKDAFSAFKTDMTNKMKSGIGGNGVLYNVNGAALFYNEGGWTINTKVMLDTILGGGYASVSGNVEEGGYGSETFYTWQDVTSSAYKTWEANHDAWQNQYDTARAAYDNSVTENNKLFTADEEALIKFYDDFFSTIADKGWTYSNEVNDTDYLNQMLQNNMYTITTVDREAVYSKKNEEYLWENRYSSSIASNFSNVFILNDSDAREEALVEYEHEKSIINEKESRIDTRMKNLETEQAAINQMLQGLEQVKNDNIERTMSTMA